MHSISVIVSGSSHHRSHRCCPAREQTLLVVRKQVGILTDRSASRKKLGKIWRSGYSLCSEECRCVNMSPNGIRTKGAIKSKMLPQIRRRIGSLAAYPLTSGLKRFLGSPIRLWFQDALEGSAIVRQSFPVHSVRIRTNIDFRERNNRGQSRFALGGEHVESSSLRIGS